MCPLGSALGLQHAFWSVLWTHANGLHVEEQDVSLLAQAHPLLSF